MNNLPKVQKKSKKSKLNGFSLHAIEYAGRTVESGDEDMYITKRDIERSKSAWERLSDSQRERYKNRAKLLNVKISSPHNSIGQKVEDVDYERNLLEEEKNKRRNEIKLMLTDAADISELDTKVFYFLSTTCFYESSNAVYPAELALVKFSLQDGVFDYCTIEINPGELEIGAAYETEVIANETHKYPLPPNCFGESDYLKILMKIIDFLPQDQNLPIFFTDGCDENSSEIKSFNSSKRVLKHIFAKAQEYDVARNLKVYSVIELFYYLKEVTTDVLNYQNFGTIERSFSNLHDAIAKFRSTDCKFLFRTQACHYHETGELNYHCSLSKCIRFGYVISKWCCHSDKYTLKPGAHFPRE